MPHLSQVTGPDAHRTRRDLFKLSAGVATGMLLSPVPWRLIKDSSLWSENWPGIPRPEGGPISTKLTNCALCPAGCPIRARCVGGRPVSLAGAGCAFGVAAHHLPYHPARLRVATAAPPKPQGRVAVLDLNPGRTASWTMRRAMAALGGTYIAPETNPVAYDLQAARTVVSVGSNLLEGWGTPAKVMAARPNFRLIHAGAVRSATAMLADEWIPIPAGGEEAFVAGFPVKTDGPILVIGDAPGVPELNRRLGAPVYARPEAPVPDAWKKQAAPITALNSVPDASIEYLLIDEASANTYVAWHEIEPKLSRGATVVTFAVARGDYARHATHAIPAPIYPEITEDIPAAIDQVAPTFRLAIPLTTPPAGVTGASDFVAKLAGIPAAGALRERAAAIDQSDEFWKALNNAHVWQGGADDRISSSVRPVVPSGQTPRLDGWLTVIQAPGTPALLSPLMTKLYEESNLHLAPNAVALNPADIPGTATSAILETSLGNCTVRVVPDPSVPRGAILTGSSPAIRDICRRGGQVKVVRA